MNKWQISGVIICVCVLSVRGQDPPTAPAVTPALLQAVEDKYSSESAKADAIVAKAEQEAAKVRKTAADVRLKAYKDRLVEVTKTGDFDKASAVKVRIEQLEKEPEGDPIKPSKRPRPKDTVKFGGHTYALMKEPATWHVAKQRCEEMGGHLVCVRSPKEEEFVAMLCGNTFAWIGATDENEEGHWVNVDGSELRLSKRSLDNDRDSEHWLSWSGSGFNDYFAGARSAYVCEWDK